MRSKAPKRPGGRGGRVKAHPLVQLLVFAVFLFFGWINLPSMFWKPLHFSWTSDSWPETRCTIVSSQVVETPVKRGTVYDVDFEYTYQVNGRSYEGTRYSYRPVLASGFQANKAIADRNPPGALVPCWFNPEAPEEAVLDREIGKSYLVGIIPLFIVAICSGGILWTLAGGRANRG